MTKMSEYLNAKYSQVTFTGEEVATIKNFQDAYAATDNQTGEKTWLVCDEDSAVFMNDADFAAHKAGCYKSILNSYGLR